MSSHAYKSVAARLAIPLLLAVMLGGCAAQMAFSEGESLVAQNQLEAGMVKYREAITRDPGNAKYRIGYLRARDRVARGLIEQAGSARANGKLAEAQALLQRVLAIDPENERAHAGLRGLDAQARQAQQLAAANAALERRDPDGARRKTAEVLTESPEHEGALAMMRTIAERFPPAPPPETALTALSKKPISIEFKDAPLRQVFDVIARTSGLNFVFDKDVKTDLRASIYLKNSTVEAAIYYLLMTNQLEQQVVDGNTIMIYPNLPAKLKEYQEMVVKTFFIAHADAKVLANTLKTILKSRDVVVDEKLNLLIVRDSAEAIRLAEKLVALQDVAEPEVVIDVEILEVKRSRLMELGIAWPDSITLSPLTTTTTTTNGTETQTVKSALTLADLLKLNRSTIGVSNISLGINANKTDGDSNILANPRIRVRNHEKAKVLIGDKVPNITTTVSPGTAGFAAQSVTYVDVGLTLNVEPTIYLNNDVAIRVGLEVSNLVSQMTTSSGAVAYQIGTRQATTMLQLKDGENQVLAGLINSEDRSDARKLPALGDIPLLGRLFGSTKDDTQKTEIVLSITPHLVRNIQRPEASASEFTAGTEASIRRRPDPAPRAPAQLPAPVQPVRAAPVPAQMPVQAPVPTPAQQPTQMPAQQPAPMPAQQQVAMPDAAPAPQPAAEAPAATILPVSQPTINPVAPTAPAAAKKR
ncbi:MAG: secretin N-terminal domain-containing protein [Pseudomonadota bacterium]